MKAELEKIRELLRCDDGPESKFEHYCEECGYSGRFATASCSCYDEAALYCRPDSRGRGCFNGAEYCPVCEEGNHRTPQEDIAKALMLVEKLLNELSKGAE